MSRWNHRLCEACWKRRAPAREPVRLNDDSGKCCECGAETTSGIFVREFWGSMLCKGVHVALVVLLSVVAGCAAADEASTCALDTRATYTVTVVPNGRPQVGTLGGLLGRCELHADEQWSAVCSGERLTFKCGATSIVYTVLDATSDGYTVEMTNPAIADSAQTLHVVAGGES